jgi:glutaredoxin
VLIISALNAQTNDTINARLPIDQFRQIIAGTYTDTLSTHIWVFGNTDCHRCEEFHNLLKERNLPFVDYNMRVPEYINIAYDLIKNAEKSEKLTFNFPVIVVNKDLYYNVFDLKWLADKIKDNYKP